MSLAQRSARRKQMMVVHRARSFAEADRWNLESWQQESPASRLSALVAIHADVAAVKRRRRSATP